MTPQIVWYLACVLLSSSIVTLGARTMYVLRAPKKFRDCWTFRNFIRSRFWISEVFPRLKFRRLEKLFLFLVDWNWLYIVVRLKWQNCLKGIKCVICDFLNSHFHTGRHENIQTQIGLWWDIFLISLILKPGYQFYFGTGLNLKEP